jgi:hypothetical protein
MQTSKTVELKTLIASIINDNSIEWKIISSKDNYCLIEVLENGKRVIVDVEEKCMYETKTKDSGSIVFDGSNHTLENVITSISIEHRMVYY